MGHAIPPRVQAALWAVAVRLDRAGVRWLVAGSTARALMGFAVRPVDLDIEVATSDADLAASTLAVTLARDDGGGWTSRRGATTIAGVSVDLSSAVTAGSLASDDETLFTASVPVGAGARQLLVLSVEEQLCRAMAAGAWGRVAKITTGVPAGLQLDLGQISRRLSRPGTATAE